jgi:hypothetical protein
MSVHRLVNFFGFTSKMFLAVMIFSALLVTSPVSANELQPTIHTTAESSTIMQRQKRSSRAAQPEMVASNNQSLANGTYLYGESNQPGKTGSEYVFFENQSGRVFGAVFLADSEFSCFHGEVHPGQLDMMVVDNYANAAHPYAINLETGSSETNSAEYRQVAAISKQELNLLESCRQMYQKSNWRAFIRS